MGEGPLFIVDNSEGGRNGLDYLREPKAAAKITDDLPELLAFYGFPAEHWGHLRATNPIESTLSTVRLRKPPRDQRGNPIQVLTIPR